MLRGRYQLFLLSGIGAPPDRSRVTVRSPPDASALPAQGTCQASFGHADPYAGDRGYLQQQLVGDMRCEGSAASDDIKTLFTGPSLSGSSVSPSCWRRLISIVRQIAVMGVFIGVFPKGFSRDRPIASIMTKPRLTMND
jgi:hypothetical protein